MTEDDKDNLDLTNIEFKHHWWHEWCLRAAHFFVWIGFWIATFQALIREDWFLFAISLMMLGIGLLIFRGVAFFMNVWVVLSAWLSAREIRDEIEIKEKELMHDHLDL